MSSNNVQQGIALICGAAAYGLAQFVGAGSGSALALGLVVGGVVLVAQGNLATKPAEETEVKAPKAPKKPHKKEKDSRAQKKQAPASPVPVQAKVEPASPEKEKANKKKKKSKKEKTEAPPASPAKPVQEQKKPAQKEEKDDTPSKAQLKKQKAKQKKEEEDKKKAEAAAKLAAEQKREAAQKKKKEAKARKAAAKGGEKPAEVVQPVTDIQEDVLEPGWEKQQSKKKKEKKEEETKKGVEVTAEIRIPSRFHGRIIGTNRSGIDKLEQALEVKIQMPRKDTSDFIKVTGSAKGVAECKKALEDIVSKGFSAVTSPGVVSQEMVLTEKSQIGIIFGPEGKHIRAIQTATKAKIQMPDKKSNDLTISFSGEPDDIRRALVAVQDLLSQGFSKLTHPGWISEELQVPPEAIGVIIGAKGAKIKELQKLSKVRIETPKRDDPTARMDIITIKGTKGNIEKAKELILEVVASTETPAETEVPDPQWQEEVPEASWD